MPKKPIDVAWMFPQLDEIRDATLKAKVVEIWNELWALSEFEDIATVLEASMARVTCSCRDTSTI